MTNVTQYRLVWSNKAHEAAKIEAVKRKITIAEVLEELVKTHLVKEGV